MMQTKSLQDVQVSSCICGHMPPRTCGSKPQALTPFSLKCFLCQPCRAQNQSCSSCRAQFSFHPFLDIFPALLLLDPCLFVPILGCESYLLHRILKVHSSVTDTLLLPVSYLCHPQNVMCSVDIACDLLILFLFQCDARCVMSVYNFWSKITFIEWMNEKISNNSLVRTSLQNEILESKNLKM